MSNRYILTFMLCILCIAAKAQTNSEHTVFSETLNLDTIVMPDYYHVEITLNDIRKRPAITIDSAEKAMRSELKKLGFTMPVLKVLVGEDTRYDYYDPRPMTARFKLIVSTKDSAQTLYDRLKFKGLYSICILPALNQKTKDVLRDQLDKKAMLKAKASTEKFASNNQLKILKVSSYYSNMQYSNDHHFVVTYPGQRTSYFDYSDVKANLMVTYSFFLD